MDDIRTTLSVKIAKKIIGNTSNAKTFLLKTQKVKNFDLPIKIIKSGKNKGKEDIELKADEVWAKVSKNWDFEIDRKVLREIFKTTDKYKLGKKSYEIMNTLFNEWDKLKFGEIKWAFSQGEFDDFVQSVNSKKVSRTEKDKKVKFEAVKYRRIKEINTVRNDFIETLIFENNENVLPTLNHTTLHRFFYQWSFV